MSSDKKQKKKKFCQTEIPKTWSKYTGPTYKDGMTVSKANALWGEFKRMTEEVGVNPTVYKKK